MGVPNRSLWAATCHGAGFAPGASPWTPCRGRDLTGPGSIPVHHPGREDRGGSGRTGLPGPIPIVLLPGFEYRMSEWQHPQAHEIHWRLERGTAAIFGDDDEKHPLNVRAVARAREPASRQQWPEPAGWFTHRPRWTDGDVDPVFSGSARPCTAAAWCASGRQCAPHGAGRQGVRGPEPGLDRCWSPEPAPVRSRRPFSWRAAAGRRPATSGGPPWAAGPPRGRDRRTQQDPALVVLNRSAVPRLRAPSKHQNGA